MGFAVQPAIDKGIAEGRVITLVRIDGVTEQGGFTAVRDVQILFGADPRPPACDPGESYTCMGTVCSGCQHHLTGDGSFAIDPSTPDDAPLVGTVSDNALEVGPGAMSLEFVNGDSPPIRFDLLGARAHVALDGSGEMLLAGGLSMSQVDDELGPLIQQVAAQIVERDCCGTPTSPYPTCDGIKGCGCRDGSQGKEIIGLFDLNHDCMLTAMEVLDSSIAQSLLAPDITVDGQDLLSVGVQTFLVGATF